MKIKLFEEYTDKKHIKSICEQYNIKNYIINSDGSIDVNNSVDLFNMELYELPLKFGKITGNFNCGRNNLKTLEGCPTYVGGYFDCHDNELETLEGSPTYVGVDFDCCNNELISLNGCTKNILGDFLCEKNKLKTLQGGPESVGGFFACNDNELISLNGSPKKILDDFLCKNNELKTLEGAPNYIGGDFSCDNNPIFEWFIQIDESNLELFIEFNVHSDDPDEINQEKIDMINEK